MIPKKRFLARFLKDFIQNSPKIQQPIFQVFIKVLPNHSFHFGSVVLWSKKMRFIIFSRLNLKKIKTRLTGFNRNGNGIEENNPAYRKKVSLFSHK